MKVCKDNFNVLTSSITLDYSLFIQMICEKIISSLYFCSQLGHRNLIKNKTQTAVIDILTLHILIMT